MVVLSATVGFNARPADVTTGPLDATLYDMLYGYLPIFLARKLSIIGNTVSLQAAPTDPTGLGVQGRWKVNTVTISVNVPLGTPGTVYIFADLSNTAVKGLTLVASVTNTPAAYQQLLGTVSVLGGAVVAGSLSLSGNVPVDPNTISASGDWRLTQGAASPFRSVFAGAVTDTVVLSAGGVSLGGALAVSGGLSFTTPAGAIVQPAWTAVLGGVGFQNAWTNYGAPYDTVQFMKDTQGFVHLRGAAAAGTLAAIIFTLPVGFRPVNTVLWAQALGTSNAQGPVVINGAGQVTQPSSGVSPTHFTGIAFATN